MVIRSLIEFDLARERRGALPLGIERLFRNRFVLLPLVDQERQSKLLVSEHMEVAGKTVAFINDLPAYAHQLGQIAGHQVGLRAYLRQHGAQRDGRAHRLQRILRPHDQRRRRLPPDTLQSGENFDDHVAAVIERLAQQLFLLVEWRKTHPRGVDISFDVAHSRGGVDEILVKFAAVLSQRLDLDAQLGLTLHGLALPGQRGVEVLVVLPDRINLIRGRWRGPRRSRRRGNRALRRGICGRRRFRRLSPCDGTCPETGGKICTKTCTNRQHQSRAEHKARIGAARPSENYRFQG